MTTFQMLELLLVVAGCFLATCGVANAEQPTIVTATTKEEEAWYLRRKTKKKTSRYLQTPSTNSNNNHPNKHDQELWGPFQLQLYWTPTSCWQEDCETHVRWCMQCEGQTCNPGDVVWIEPCRANVPQQLFYWRKVMEVLDTTTTTTSTTTSSGNHKTKNDTAAMGALSSAQQQVQELVQEKEAEEQRENEDDLNNTRQRRVQGLQPQQTSPREVGVEVIDYGQLIVQMEPLQEEHNSNHNHNNRLCLDRMGRNRYQLQRCFSGRQRQWFRGLSTDGHPFELRPMDVYAIDRTDPKCVTMHHHPRQYETIRNEACVMARTYSTNYWMATLPTSEQGRRDDASYYGLHAPRQDPRCLPFDPCGMCQGHCQDDSDCIGHLKCFERNRVNPYEAPPGCYGTGVARIDYCYAEDDN